MTELQTAYYLLEGDSYVPKAPEPFEVSLPGALRILYGMERSAAAEFRSAADTAEDPSAAALYRRLEDGAKKHAAQLFGLIKTFMV